MVRTQIQITESQSENLHRQASRTGRSIADLIRECIDRYLEVSERNKNDLRERALRVAGRFSSGKSDISAEHDRYLAEDYLG